MEKRSMFVGMDVHKFQPRRLRIASAADGCKRSLGCVAMKQAPGKSTWSPCPSFRIGIDRLLGNVRRTLEVQAIPVRVSERCDP
jgi:hypothetical protein